MTTITPGYTGQYYQLPGQSGQTTNPGNSALSSSSPSLASALSGTSQDNAYVLDLSDNAQDFLNQSSAASPDDVSPNASFTLTAQQWQKIGEILAKYKDEPQTQDTYNQIQNDLQEAGLSPTQLAQQDSLQSFNATQVFIDALNGKTDAIPSPNDATEKTKSNNYMQQVYKQWQTITSS